MTDRGRAGLVIAAGLLTLGLAVGIERRGSAELDSQRHEAIAHAKREGKCSDPLPDVMLRFDLASSEQDVADVLRPAECGQIIGRVLDAENQVDFGFLVAYSLLQVAVVLYLLRLGLPQGKLKLRDRWLLGAGILAAAVMLLGDFAEDLQLLRLTRPGPHPWALQVLPVATHTKWGALALASLFIAALHWSRNRLRSGHLLSLVGVPYLAAGLVGVAALATGEVSWYRAFGQFLAVAWGCSMLQAALWLLGLEAGAQLKQARQSLLRFLQVLWPCSVSVVVVTVVTLALGLVPQGEDILESFAETSIDAPWQMVAFFVTLLVYAAAAWYAARVALYFRVLGEDEPEDAWRQSVREDEASGRPAPIVEGVPRWIGVSACGGLALAFLHLLIRYNDRPGDSDPLASSTRWTIRGLALAALVLGWLFLVAVKHRRQWIEKFASLKPVRAAAARRGRLKPAPPIVAVKPHTPSAAYMSFTKAPPGTRAAVIVILLLAGAALVLFSKVPLAARAVGSASVVFLAAAAWLPLGALVSYQGRRLHLPLLGLLLLAAIPFTWLNDNHPVRVTGHAFTGARTIEQELVTWRDFIRRKEGPGKHPIVIVAAEGGGSLSGYWTASVLSKIQDEARIGNGFDFADHVFAMSCVSGGSLGCAVFSGLAAEPGLRSANFHPLATYFMKQDFLSPTLAMMLFPELLQKVLPVPIDGFDRSRAIEGAWETAWSRTVCGSKRFSEPFAQLFRGDGGPSPPIWVPRLVLNSTWVESGNRALTTTFEVDRTIFADSSSVLALLGSDVPLSTAVHNSARFPYVNPPGRVDDREGKNQGHLIDGGLFESSGGSTALEIVAKLLELLGEKGKDFADLGPIFVVLANSIPVEQVLDPKQPADTDCAAKPRQPVDWHSKQPSRGFLLGGIAPPVALMNSRGARATWAVDHLYRFPCKQVSVYQFGTCPKTRDGKHTLPLPVSWEISTLAQETMDEQLKEGCGKTNGFNNPDGIRELIAKLKEPRTAPLAAPPQGAPANPSTAGSSALRK